MIYVRDETCRDWRWRETGYCRKCQKQVSLTDLVRLDTNRDQRFYCPDCAYEEVERLTKICPVCRNKFVDISYGECEDFCERCNITKNHKIRNQININLRRTEKANLVSDLTLLEWFDTLRHFGYSCVYCGGEYTDLEHYIPVVKGGGTTKRNCVPACSACNSSKHDRLPHRVISLDFVFEIESYLYRP